jgi:hypothetical protein
MAEAEAVTEGLEQLEAQRAQTAAEITRTEARLNSLIAGQLRIEGAIEFAQKVLSRTKPSDETGTPAEESSDAPTPSEPADKAGEQ